MPRNGPSAYHAEKRVKTLCNQKKKFAFTEILPPRPRDEHSAYEKSGSELYKPNFYSENILGGLEGEVAGVKQF